MFYFGLDRVLSQNVAELLKYVKYITGSLSMHNLWAINMNIVDSISTALCFFLHSYLSVMYVQLGAFLPDITPRIKSRGVMSIATNYLKTSFNYKNI